MLAARLRDLSQLRYPCLATPKLDGIRCVIHGGQVLTRAFKLVPNEYVREALSSLPEGCDGELVLPEAVFSESQGAVMSRDGRPDFVFACFDVAGEGGYSSRVQRIPEAPRVQRILPVLLECRDQFLEYEESCLELGFEGVITRAPLGPYKYGRSTPTEQWLVKHKRIDDGEAVVVGFEEQMRNTNPVEYNVFGYAKRPGGFNDGYGREPKGTLGSFVCVDCATRVQFGVGSGMDDRLRAEVWEAQELYIGRTLQYLHQGFGVNGRPRFPRFNGLKDESEMQCLATGE
jgi:DNA ligase-1